MAGTEGIEEEDNPLAEHSSVEDPTCSKGQLREEGKYYSCSRGCGEVFEGGI